MGAERCRRARACGRARLEAGRPLPRPAVWGSQMVRCSAPRPQNLQSSRLLLARRKLHQPSPEPPSLTLTCAIRASVHACRRTRTIPQGYRHEAICGGGGALRGALEPFAQKVPGAAAVGASAAAAGSAQPVPVAASRQSPWGLSDADEHGRTDERVSGPGGLAPAQQIGRAKRYAAPLVSPQIIKPLAPSACPRQACF